MGRSGAWAGRLHSMVFVRVLSCSFCRLFLGRLNLSTCVDAGGGFNMSEIG